VKLQNSPVGNAIL